MLFSIMISMENGNGSNGKAAGELLASLRNYGPVAKGSLALVHARCAKKGCRACRDGKGHPSWIFTFWEDGRHRCLHVRKGDVGVIRKALERGREVESLLVGEGVRLIRALRGADADCRRRSAGKSKPS